jgi:hypothetical protein
MPAMKKDHRIEVAALAAVVRAVFVDLAALGRTPPAQAMAALELVDRWLAGSSSLTAGGADIDVAALQAAADLSHQDGVPYAQREKDRSLNWARTAAGNLAWMAKKDRGWEKPSVMDAAFYALSSLGIAGTKDDVQLEAIRKAALKNAPDFAEASSGKPKSKPVKAGPKLKRVDLSKFIGAAAQKRLAKRKPMFDAAQRGDEAALRALLSKRGYVAHDAVLAFDARYGGLVAADSPGEEGFDWLFGAFACLKSNAHADPRGKAGWVPVAYSPNDCIFYLDEKGAAWVIDTIGDTKPSRYASDGDAMLKRIFTEN